MRSALIGPYDLSYDTVQRALPAGMCGVYALGHVDSEGTFRIQRIGRDDTNLRQCLRDLIGSSTRFKYAPAASAQLAFESECELFHKFQPPGNVIHPDRPKGSGWKCPVCSQSHR